MEVSAGLTGTAQTRLPALGWTSSDTRACCSSHRRFCPWVSKAHCLLSAKALRRSPEKEKGSFERWDLRRGSDSWAQREMGRERQPAEAAEAIPDCAESWEWG